MAAGSDPLRLVLVVAALAIALAQQQGLSYVRWGVSNCPSSASLIYSGYTAGSGASSGGGANFLCLPSDPQYLPGSFSGASNNGADVSRAEYMTLRGGVPSLVGLHGMEIPCALCARRSGPTSIVIPGQTSCPAGLTADYAGYLLAPPANRPRAEAICLDQNAVGIGSSSLDGLAFLSPVEVGTGTATPLNYNQGFEVTCVRCSGNSTSGSLYTRWGRTSCPASATRVYQGMAASSYWGTAGGVLNQLCMSSTPQYLQVTAGIQSSAFSSSIFRTEYRTNTAALSAAWNALQNADTACVVCQAPPNRQYSFVQPGSATCPNGFTTDYQGYLMSSASTQQRTSFICVDADAERAGDAAISDGSLLYLIQTTNTINAPLSYSPFYEVSCAHCTAAPNTGSVYVNFGETTCPSDNTLLYSGQTGGAFATLGGGNNYLCLTSPPGYLNYNPAGTTNSLLYAAEYSTVNGGNPFVRPLSGFEIPCSVCQRPAGRSNSFINPGKTGCPSGTTVDAAGSLMAPAAGSNMGVDRRRGEFVCVASDATTMGVSNVNLGAVMSTVEGVAPLPPGYLAWGELACTTCSFSASYVPPPPPPPPTNTAGSTYVRWGRTVCPASAAIVYVGTAGGPASGGNGANMQCLPTNPQYQQGQYSESASTSNAFLSKAEYGTWNSGIQSLRIMQGMDVPCVVCKRLLQDSRSLMVPGRQLCPTGFSVDYTGYLFAPSGTRGEFFCLDSAPEGAGSSQTENGYLVSSVEAGTGAAAPPFYTQGYELTCVQCGSNSFGAVYTRWGSQTCPPDASLVYSGLMGSSFFTSMTGGSDYLCLSSQPTYQAFTALRQRGSTSIFRVEYETAGQLNAAWTSKQDMEAACAVCQVNTARSYSFMHPGRTDCPAGFSVDYSGYLMTTRSGNPLFYRTSYICVDQNAPGVGSAVNENGGLLYFTTTSNTNNAPMAFSNNNEVSCAHCTVSTVSGGSTYVQWGSQTCPPGSTIVYEGQTGGAMSFGAGTDLLCLPMTPLYGFTNPATGSSELSNPSNGLLYAQDYSTWSNGVRLFQPLNGFQVPCALCQRPVTRSYSVMTPASTSCAAGFVLDYQGFLVSSPQSSFRSSYICVTALAGTLGSRTNTLGGLLAPTQSAAPLPLGYMSGYEMPCTVCSGAKAGSSPPPPPPPPQFNMSSSGAVFIRWGVSTCPDTSTLLYAGQAASSQFASTGSGVNVQCLPSNPQYIPGQYSDALNNGGFIQRVEYITAGSGILSMQALHGTEVPCAVCNRQNPLAKTLMVPGTYLCPNGFMPDYQGYLFAPPTTSSSTPVATINRGEHLCVDANAVGMGSTGVEGGSYISPVEAASTINSNLLSGYNQGYELSCVVCGSVNSGSIYTRWGRTTCPASASLVYSGAVAGQAYQTNGGGANYLCMSDQPTYLNFTAGTQGWMSQLFRTEYKTINAQLNATYNSLHNFEMPCAVCQSQPTRMYSFVQHGNTNCPAGFFTDFIGYVMAGDTTNPRTSFLCVDEGMQGIGTNIATEISARIHFQQTSVVSASSPLGYNSGYAVTCAHCSANAGGSVYVDWGETTCPAGSNLLYSGQVGGSYFTYGGGYEYLCLTPLPSYLLFNSLMTAGGQIYATEYQTGNSGVASLRSENGGQVPCSVCQRTGGRPSTMMIPAVTTCPLGFGVDYIGYLASPPASNSRRGEYVCLSVNAQYIGNRAITFGSTMFAVEGRTPLPQGYFNGYEISCVVCSACSGDSYINASGSCVPATICTAGSFVSTQPTPNSDRVCTACPTGTFQNLGRFVGTACTTCVGTFQDETGATACKACSPGFFLTGPSGQQACPAGSACSNCQQSLCPRGRFQPQTGSSACLSCPSSRYQDELGQVQCKACDPGTFSSDSTSLSNCPAGSFCLSCARTLCGQGTFQSATAQSACTACPATSFQNELGASACKSCSTGFYRLSPSAQTICPAGSACTACTMTPCPTGTFQNSQGATSCIATRLCPAGWFSSSNPTPTSDRGCLPCPAQSFNPSPNILPACTSATQCGPGTFISTPATPTSNTICSNCPPNTFQDLTGQTACKPLLGCNPGFFTSSLPQNGPRVCSPCSAGFSFQNEAGFTGVTCKTVSPICAPGSFQSVPPTISSDRTCAGCTGTTNFQDLAGQSSCRTVSTCGVGTVQSAAPTRSSDRQCSSCDGTSNFQNEAGMTQCKPMTTCAASTQYITVQGTTSSNRVCDNCRTSCSGSFYLTGTCGGQSNPSCAPCFPTCLTCSGPTSSNCRSCPTGLIFSAADGTCTANCTAGRFSSGGQCLDCSSNCTTCAGTSTTCLSCSATTFLLGSVCVATCPANFITASNPNRCVPCSNCSAGTFRFAACVGSTDTNCRSWQTCPVGQFQSVAPTATSDRGCQPCPVPASFQPAAGQAFCLSTTTCQPGSFVTANPTASTDRTCSPCAAGTAQAASNQPLCPVCPTGQFQSQPGQPGCLPCPIDSFQAAQGQTACTVVPPGFFRSNDGAARLPCPAGSFCPGGASPPVPCNGLTQFQNNTQATSCLPVALCSAGQFQAVAPSPSNDRVCSPCPSGTFTSQNGNALTSCTPFQVCNIGTARSFNGSATSDVSCVACVNGSTFQDEQGAFGCKTTSTCGQGTFVAVQATVASNRICQSCISGVNFQDLVNQPSCKLVVQCAPGQFQSAAATLTSNAICPPCAANTFQNEAGLPSCKPVSVCSAGEFSSQAPTRSSDRVCTACPQGTFQPSAGVRTACQAATVCPPGSFVVSPATPTSNFVCASCQLGSSFQNEAGATACITADVCGAGELVATNATLTSDRICQGCPEGTFQDAPVTFAPVCKPVRSVCPVGTAQNVAPTPTNDRSCLPCDGINFYSDVPGLTLCKTATVCNNESYIFVQPTAFSDRQCRPCLTQDDCRLSEIIQGTCNGSLSVTTCVPCFQTCATCNDTTPSSCQSCIPGLNLDTLTGACVSSCRDGQYAGARGVCQTCNGACATCVGPTASNCSSCPSGRFLTASKTCVSTCPQGTYASPAEGRCLSCTGCQPGTYATANCTPTANTGCTAWSVCAAGTYEVTAGTALTDRVCTACNGVTQYQDQAGQFSCKAATVCTFPNVQGLPPTRSTDRLCICDTPTCTSQVTQTYNANLCAAPTADQLSSSVSDCCAGTTNAVLVAILQASTQFEDRHTCPGCLANNCSCAAGYFQSITATGSTCQPCDGQTGFSSQVGLTACSPVSVCSAGSQQTQAPTPTSNRVCSACAAGTTDVNRTGLACTACPPGGYVPPASSGPCSQFLCPAGSANGGPDASTPCAPCPAGTFQPLAGQTTCNQTTVCAAGFEEFVMPSPVSNRFCRACILGFTFKAVSGQASSCTPVARCGVGEQETAAPTLSSDRVCSPCPAGTFKNFPGEFPCTPVTECGVGQEEIQVPTAISNRVCRSCVVGVSFKPTANLSSCQPVTPCSGAQYQLVAPTVSSDRQCRDVTNCAVGLQYQAVPPTITSDRLCANCTSCPAGRFQIRECSFLQDAQCAGCTVCITGQYQTAACTTLDNTVCANCTSACPRGYYQTAPCTPFSNSVCEPTTRCEMTEYIAIPATAVTDNVCRPYTSCNTTYQYTFVEPTSTSNRICRDLTVCQPGSEVVRRPGPSEDRVCALCKPGFTDADSTGLDCERCTGGAFVPVGSSGPCSQFACPPGTADLDGLASTPCVSCNFTVSYQGLSGQTACAPVSQCGPGFQEVAAPTLFTNRVCQACLAGVTFKDLDGSVMQCQFVTQCAAWQYMTAPPTISSDRTCANITACNSTQFQTQAPTASSDRTCRALTVCNNSQYQLQAPTETSDRVCAAISFCSAQQFELQAPTATSDRQCQQISLCLPPAFEAVPPTSTSDRRCTITFSTSMYFSGDFDTVASSPDGEQTFKNAFNTTVVNLGLSASAIAGVTVQRGSILLIAYVFNQTTRTWLYTQALSGNLTVLGSSPVLCPTGLFTQLPLSTTGGPVVCLPPSQCGVDYYQAAPMTATSDVVCRVLTPCPVTAIPPTATSDRVCAVLNEASRSDSSSALSPVVLGIIVVLMAVVVALVVGMLLIYRKRVKDRARRQADYDQARIAETNRAFQDGNVLLSQLNKGGTMNFSNPIFAGKPAEGYLDVSPTPDWMAGNLSREQAEAALSSRVIGGFLIRASNASGCFVLSMKIAENEYEHHRIQQVGNTFTLNGKPLSRQCPTINDVLDHLSQNPDGISCCIAHTPGNAYGVKKEEEPSFYGAHAAQEEESLPLYGAHQPWLCKLSRKEATDRLIRENPVRGHFLIRESESKPGTFAVSLVISARDVEHHSLLRGIDGIFLLNDRPMARRCADLPAVVDHLSTNKETMTCTLDASFYGGPAVQGDDLYSDVRNRFPGATGTAPVEQALANPMYYTADMDSQYSHLPPVRLPGPEVPMPQYFDPTATRLGDGYMSVVGAEVVPGALPVVHSDRAVHSYENVPDPLPQRKRETSA